MLTKSLSRVEIKDADEGVVSAVFATLGVVDLDGDVTVKGAFDDGAKVVMSAYGHTSHDGQLPIGKGVIREVGNEAVFEGRFFLNTTHGRDAFETVKSLSEDDLQEWSYSLHDVVSEKGVVDGRKVQILRKIRVKEVSPVLLGAGVNTRTLEVKSSKFSEQSDIALRGVKELVEMAVERLTHRAAEGKAIEEQTEAYDLLVAELAPLRAAIDAATQPPITDDSEAQAALADAQLLLVSLSQGEPS